MMSVSLAKKCFLLSLLLITACSSPPLLNLSAGESDLVLNATHLESVDSGQDAAGTAYVRLTLSAQGMSDVARFTEKNIGKDLEIFHEGKKVSAVPLRDKLGMKEVFVAVKNKAEADNMAMSIGNGLQVRLISN